MLVEVLSDGVLENMFANPVEGLLNMLDVLKEEVVLGPKAVVVCPKPVPTGPIEVVEELNILELNAGVDP